MLKIYVGNLPPEATQEEVSALFANHGRVRSIDVAKDIFSGKCRGFGFVEMEGHEARAAINALNGYSLHGNNLRVNQERPKNQRGGRRR
ncbi:RNA recognition motif-containing protein [Methylohalomonas lacus]|uniref:RNA recognition motif-containing protein n=1 Tax=Methylohalomonas lacus TaxID=398773 RepID=A0AAE3HMN5_9GAMM|nr:RNA-binding protein [Methylohalomonas lacus]MCS3904128.1 RNA recognition motif-containing protein [Methylohalomonas lacus]